jgi:hypothetical protein
LNFRLRKIAIVLHRWLGVFLCLLFAMWFLSGIVMMYWSYPEVGAPDRLERAPVLDASRIRVSPAEALASLHSARTPNQGTLETLAGRPYIDSPSAGRSGSFTPTRAKFSVLPCPAKWLCASPPIGPDIRVAPRDSRAADE